MYVTATRAEWAPRGSYVHRIDLHLSHASCLSLFSRPQDQGSQQLIQAQVTITLDNTDGRLPVESPTVSIGRTVGLKKDEYFLGGKSVKKGDVTAVLESAGFSRANPYYIVAQGKVAQLADMDDK